MSEFWIGNQWYMVDWINKTCIHADFGISIVRPDWFLSASSVQLPPQWLYESYASPSQNFYKVNGLHLPNTSQGEFFYYTHVDSGEPFRIKSPGADAIAGKTVMVDYVTFKAGDMGDYPFTLPPYCNSSLVKELSDVENSPPRVFDWKTISSWSRSKTSSTS
ncbi:hypothetical protein CYMTET_49307 [Cymbomonas tetramitiformis]|uniref:Uncharacterized protein n=1 Tax=Cymbomonas tetramitiformis TaxID=36881 RepID=A0AAE0BS51_9CHLO|nr:hypothetical protein CYMTET_49307 [Cymbomonas tetramitiformis]